MTAFYILIVFIAGLAAGIWAGRKFALERAAAAQLVWEQEKISLENQRISSEEHFKALAAAYEAQFSNLAAKIFDEKSKGLENKNTEVLTPLRLQLDTFIRKVDEMKVSALTQKELLEVQLAELLKSTEKIDQSALDLAGAIKGEAVVRGWWGEESLKRILDMAGMTEGVDYFEQAVGDERKRADILVALPGERWIVIDSKTIFNHYAAYYNEQDPEKKADLLDAHVKDVKKTILDLSKKEYFKKFENTSEKIQPEYTLMFVYPESALLAAVSKDPTVLQEAWKNNIALVSATSLMSTLKMVAKLWDAHKQQEYMAALKKEVAKLMLSFNHFLVQFASAESAVQDAFSSIKTARGHIHGDSGSILPTAQRIADMYDVPVVSKENARLLKRMGYDYDGCKSRMSTLEK